MGIAKSFVFKLNDYDITRRFFIDVLLARKLNWKYHNPKSTAINMLSNLPNIYYPSLKQSKGNQIKKLFSKINISVPEEGFIFTIDEFKSVNYENTIIDNLSVDYSKILYNSLNDLYNHYKQDNEYCQNQKQTLDAIKLLIDRQINELGLSNRQDKQKYINYLENIKHSPAKDFEEALQRILFFNQILWQTGHGLNGFGRLDKVLNDIYQKDSISKTETLNLIKDFLKAGHSYFYYKSTALPGDTGQIIVLGGKKPDNSYFANDLTYLFLQAVKELNLPDPKIILRYADNIPRDLIELGLECMATGVGSPLISNDELVIDYLMDFGYEKEFAHDYVVSACWEPAPIAKGLELNNLNTLVFLNPLNKLLDNEDLTKLETFDLLLEKYKSYLRKYSNDLIDEINKREWETDPLLSLFIDDCDKNFIDVSKGGAYYNNFGFTSVSLSNTVDSLINIKKLVYEDKDFTLEELNNHRLNNFEDEHVLEVLKNQKVKFGMDDETVIELSKEIMDTVQEIFSTKSTKYGGKFKFGLSSPAYLSSAPDIKASLDGRRDFEAFDVHISLDENQDYTELMRFASKLDYSGCKFNGNVVDFMVSPDFITKNFDKFLDFIILSFKMGVFQMQLNVVSSEILIKAKKNPQDYPNLIVRVWGFSAYFNDLPNDYQDLLIKRAIENERKNN